MRERPPLMMLVTLLALGCGDDRRSRRRGGTERIPLDAKPPNEFQTNFPMTGGGTRYGVRVEGASDRVINMRLPVNHHVTFAVVFQRLVP